MNPEDSFERGFTDAYHGKDKREDYYGDNLEQYILGHDKFWKEWSEGL